MKIASPTADVSTQGAPQYWGICVEKCQNCTIAQPPVNKMCVENREKNIIEPIFTDLQPVEHTQGDQLECYTAWIVWPKCDYVTVKVNVGDGEEGSTPQSPRIHILALDFEEDSSEVTDLTISRLFISMVSDGNVHLDGIKGSTYDISFTVQRNTVMSSKLVTSTQFELLGIPILLQGGDNDADVATFTIRKASFSMLVIDQGSWTVTFALVVAMWTALSAIYKTMIGFVTDKEEGQISA